MKLSNLPTRVARRVATRSLACVGVGAALLGVAGAVRAQSSESPDIGVGVGAGLGADARPRAASAWNFGAFGTIGAVRQTGGDGWGFVRSSDQPGATSRLSLTPDTRLGGQLNWNGGPRWEAALQALWMNRPSGVPLSEAFPYAYLGHRPAPDTRVRIGRTSPDLFLYAESRNIGYALPWVRPPGDFYGFVPLTAIDGIDLEQRWSSGAATWRARATGGVIHGSVVDPEGGRVPLVGRPAWALGVTREEGGLTLRASYAQTRLTVDVGTGLDQLRQGLDQIALVPAPALADTIDALRLNTWSSGRVSYLGLGAQYETGPWTFTAEGSRLWVPDGPLGALRGYVSTGWRHGSVTYFGLVGRVRPNRAAANADNVGTALAPLIGPAAAAQAQTVANYLVTAGGHYRYDQSTVAAGIRWDFIDNAALKLQLDRFDVRAQGGAAWRRYDGRASTGTLLSVALDFVLAP